MKYEKIIKDLPYSHPFLFVDELDYVDAERVEGSFTFRKELAFYSGHFKERPVTPGVILMECCAQIGLVCLGIYLSSEALAKASSGNAIALSSAEMEFYKAVYPGEKVVVESEKIYFRFHKLKCSVKMFNQSRELVCRGVLAGMMLNTK
jgi:3-hydroxyacyl-[acyl-carrier-protein] dehydratase